MKYKKEIIYCGEANKDKLKETLKDFEQFRWRELPSIKEIKDNIKENPWVVILWDMPFSSFEKSILTPFAPGILLIENKKNINNFSLLSGINGEIIFVPFEKNELLFKIKRIFSFMELAKKGLSLNKKIEKVQNELDTLNKIGISLAAERDLNALLGLILDKSLDITSSDAGSIYLVIENQNAKKDQEKMLQFSYTRNFSRPIDMKSFTMKISKESIAGYVAKTREIVNIKDAYNIPKDKPYTFNKDFDIKNNYYTKSMLAIPLIDHRDEIIGVLQLINRKRKKDIFLTSPEIAKREVIPYDKHSIEIISSLAGQAAISIENAMLYESIENLFEGLVKASVTAIESRDPTTKGHSERVAKLSVALAEKINETSKGKFKDVKFSPEEIRELRYAALLHDFGKIGIAKHLLVKAEKLYPFEKEKIKYRFELIKERLKSELYKKKFEMLNNNGKRIDQTKSFEIIDKEYNKKIKEIDKYFLWVEKAACPFFFSDDLRENIKRLGNLSIAGINCLESQEVKKLTIVQGSLTEEERKEIQSHVIHSFRFLSQIPWTKDLKNLPEIAYGHHERLDGTGYPRGLKEDKIPLQSKIMIIADIYDALTAWDRPYKKSITPQEAIKILKLEAKDNHIDLELVKIFKENRLYELVKKEKV